MRPGRIAPLALVAMSLLFFVTAIAPLTDIVLRSIGTPPAVIIPLSSMIWDFSLLGLISLCGGIVFLANIRKENPSWYLGIPLVVAYAVIVLSRVIGGLIVIHDPSPPLYHPGVVCSLLSSYGTVFLLPPCAALFFWSEKRLGRWVTVMAGIALVVTLNSLIVMFYVLSPYLVTAGLLPPAQPHIAGQPITADGQGLEFLILAYMIGLPVIGICTLALAVILWHNARRPVKPPLPSAGKRN
ncbi:MAG TPA: hypothetical protein PKM50_00760 [Methanoregula sp.]|nr:hypothetical protein [Methanoregula sp.]